MGKAKLKTWVSSVKISKALSNLIKTKERIEALRKYFVKPTKNNKEFLTAAKRLVRIVEPGLNGNIDISSLKTEQEKSLFNSIEDINKRSLNPARNYF